MVTAVLEYEFTRNTGAEVYAAGDLVADELRPEDVTPLAFDLTPLRGANGFRIEHAIMGKSQPGTANEIFNVNLGVTSL